MRRFEELNDSSLVDDYIISEKNSSNENLQKLFFIE